MHKELEHLPKSNSGVSSQASDDGDPRRLKALNALQRKRTEDRQQDYLDRYKA